MFRLAKTVLVATIMPSSNWAKIVSKWFMMPIVFAGHALAQEAAVSAPVGIVSGAEVQITWQGPNAPGDFIAIADPDAAAASFLSYARTSGGNPALFAAPAEGDYQVRYISAARLSVLATAALSVGPVGSESGITAVPEVEAGGEITVGVSEPGEPANYITIVPPEDARTALGPYARLRGATEVSLNAPNTEGVYEIRHIRATDQMILSIAALKVLKAAPAPDAQSDAAQAPSRQVTLIALIAVDALHPFHVAWSGVGVAGDKIDLVAVGSTMALDSRSVLDGTQVELTAPEKLGAYELVFISGASGDVLARRGIEVR